MDRLEPVVMPYAWGSRTAIAELTGRPPSERPEAELWMGAHPLGPSALTRDGQRTTLAEIVSRAPERELGARGARELGPRLPFLLKVLAAAEPLSIQAHPDAARARAGFDHEEAAGVPRDAAHRKYKDASHKPELLCALTPFDALCGFRAAADTLRLFDAVTSPELDRALAPLRASPDPKGLADTFRAIMTAGEGARRAMIDAVRRAAAGVAEGAPFARELAWAERIAALYPDDAGVISALMLNLVRLEPGEAIYLGAGNLHAYLEGVGVEIMASSDNVLRGGLTKKHIDLAELLAVLDFVDAPVAPLRPRRIDDAEGVYDTPAREFRLSRLTVRPGSPVTRTLEGPEILLCTEGSVRSGSVELGKGASAFVPAADGAFTLEGEGTVYRAATNLS